MVGHTSAPRGTNTAWFAQVVLNYTRSSGGTLIRIVPIANSAKETITVIHAALFFLNSPRFI